MQKFYKQSLTAENIPTADKGIRVSELLVLIKDSEYLEEIKSLFKIENIINEIISIPGARLLVKSILEKDEQFLKFDVAATINDVSVDYLNDDNSLHLKFTNVQENRAREIIENDEFEADTIYSAKSSFFELFKMEKYATYCLQEGNKELVFTNLSALKDKYGSKKNYKRSYRIVKDQEDHYYVRAITSTARYYDYNVRFSLFITLLVLRNSIIQDFHSYSLNYFEYDESSIKVYFERSGSTKIKGLGNLRFQFEMINDEIKRDAMRFAGVCILDIPQTDGDTITLKPSQNKSKILTVRHNILPSTMYKDLSTLKDIGKIQKEMFDDIAGVNKIANPDELRFKLYQRLENIKNEFIKDEKVKITALVKDKIGSLHELLVMMGKVEKLVTDLDARDYLRYIFYDVITNKKSDN